MKKLTKPNVKIVYPKKYTLNGKMDVKEGKRLGNSNRTLFNFIEKASTFKERDKIIDYWINKFYAPEWGYNMIRYYRSNLKKSSIKSKNKKPYYVKDKILFVLYSDGSYAPYTNL